MAQDKPVTLAAIIGAHGVTGEVRLKLFGEGVDALSRYGSFNDGALTLRKLRDDNKGGAIARFAEVTDRNRAEGRDSILSHAEDEMAYADRIGKRVVIGLEFNPGEPAKLSFHGMDEADFEREAAKVEAAYAKRPAFAGFVFHHYEGYRRFVGAPAPAAK